MAAGSPVGLTGFRVAASAAGAETTARTRVIRAAKTATKSRRGALMVGEGGDMGGSNTGLSSARHADDELPRDRQNRKHEVVASANFAYHDLISAWRVALRRSDSLPRSSSPAEPAGRTTGQPGATAG